MVPVAMPRTVTELYPPLGLIQIWQPFMPPVNGSEPYSQMQNMFSPALAKP